MHSLAALGAVFSQVPGVDEILESMQAAQKVHRIAASEAN